MSDPSVKVIHASFMMLFESLRDPSFKKSLGFQKWTERELSPLVRSYLLGRFGQKLSVEDWVALPGSQSGFGRVDFKIGNVAVELAVREAQGSRAKLQPSTNTNEIKKLMKHRGKAVLVFLDFSPDPFTKEELERFRDVPSLGRGPHKKSPFHVSHHGIKGSNLINVRV